MKNKDQTKTSSHFFFGYFKHLLLVFLAAEFPLLVFWTANLGQIRASVALKPLLWIFIVEGVLFSIFCLLLRSTQKSALLILLFSMLFFTYGQLVNLLEPVFPSSTRLITIMLLIIYGLAFLTGAFLIMRSKKKGDSLTNTLLILFSLLAVYNAGRIVLFDPRLSENQPAPQINVTNTLNPTDPPDVYVIVLDSYARADLLLENYGYDNSPFIDSLKQRGFYIPECSYSNYERTHISVPSILNMNYADQMGIPNSELNELTPHQVDLILNNEASKIFRGLGYQTVTARGFGAFDDIQNADIYLNYYNSIGQSDELADRNFLYLFIRTTLLRVYFEPIGSSSPTPISIESSSKTKITSGLGYEEARFWYDQTNYVFDSLSKLPQESGKYFVYAHINSPHSPYVFYPDGSFHFATDYSNERTLYTDAITYLNSRVLELVDDLISNSSTPPVIIILADHGPDIYETGIDHHKILSAYYMPGKLDIDPYSTITPVNALRIVIHDYFDPAVELLPDLVYLDQNGEYSPVPATCNLK